MLGRGSVAGLHGFFILVAIASGGCDPAPVPGRKMAPTGPSDAAVAVTQEPPAEAGAAVRDAGSEPDPQEPSVEAGDATIRDAAGDLAPSLEGGASTASGMDAPTSDASLTADAASDALGDAGDGAFLRAPRPGELAIVEILANPSGQDLGREWIEVLSQAAETLDVSTLHASDGTTDAAVAAGSIAPGARIVLGQSADPTKNGGAPIAAAYGTHLILNNDDEQIAICVGPCATGVVIDRVAWGATGAAYDGHAIVVDPATKAICPARDPFGTAGDFGTPGQPNPPCASDPGTDAGADAGTDPGADAGTDGGPPGADGGAG